MFRAVQLADSVSHAAYGVYAVTLPTGMKQNQGR